MLFNSIDFAIFLPLVFAIHWFLIRKNIRQQNLFIVLSSYIFYGWWDWRFLSLILFSTIVDYSVGLLLARQSVPAKRKFLLWTSIIVNIGLLGVFKYYNFFLENFVTAFTFMGRDISANSLRIVLPVGISFYTFQTLSYSIDVYRRKLEPTSDFAAFAAFVSFFPQLVAGPIERATNLLPQFSRVRVFDYEKAKDGMRQILWGLFKKIVIADNCAEFVNMFFDHPGDYSGSTLLLGALFFAFQIYGDFSGYSDIAIGAGRLLGINLMQNFAFPYFSRDIAEFWRRWHISLSTWFRDYLYIPLGGSRGNSWQKIRNIMIVFMVSGFWHGANWTFIAWGALNGLLLLSLMLTSRNRDNLGIVARGRIFPTIREFSQIVLTFTLTLFLWIFFRAETIGDALGYISGILSPSLFMIPSFAGMKRALITLILIVLFVIVEWKGREDRFAIESIMAQWRRPYRHLAYYLILAAIFFLGGAGREFIYFQF